MFRRYTRPKLYILLVLTACAALVFIAHFKLYRPIFNQVYTPKRENLEYLPYYFAVGFWRPSDEDRELIDTLSLWPEEDAGDRILHQLLLMPPNNSHVKYIYAPREAFNHELGSGPFKECLVDRCEFVKNFSKADAIVFKDQVSLRRTNIHSNQVWILYALESPYVSGEELIPGTINWTATYRMDSDIVTPYEKWVYYDEDRRKARSKKNYAAGKTKKVAWFVSNCVTTNSRLEYARELQNYIDVDIYGTCGSLECHRGSKDCFAMLRQDYKFYLAFENSNCRNYITEKFFVNALQNKVLPVVMGAHPSDYKQVAPDHSYIHVEDFPSARELADYLHMLDADDALYSDYFRWQGMGEFVNTRFFCRLCAMLHYPRSKSYSDFRRWWIGTEDNPVCRSGSWYV